MIIKEQLTSNIIRYYSDSNKYIRRIEDGAIFKERLDVVGGRWTYEESEMEYSSENMEDKL